MALTLLVLCAAPVFSQHYLQVTEIFSGQVGADLTADWFEITNTGDAAWVSGVDDDLYYDDDSASPVEADLIQGITDIQPGEAVIVLVTANAADVVTFSSIWGAVINLNGIKIGTTDGAGLGGGGDQVTLWVGDPNTNFAVDLEYYPNTAGFDGKSWDADLGVFSEVGNISGAVATLALGGDNANVPNIGSPGNQGSNSLNAPVINGNTAAAAPWLNINFDSPSAVGMDRSDPTDPVRTHLIPFFLSDNDTPPNDLIISVSSNNQAVVPNANIGYFVVGADLQLQIIPVQIGYAAITITATDPEGNTGNYVIQLAVSDATIYPNATRFHYGTSDGSTAESINSDFMWIGDDENQTLRLYDRHNSGLPIKALDFNTALGSTNEVDIEGSFRSGDTIYWMGSHTTQQRSVIFSTKISGNGVASTLTYTGHYRSLLNDLIAWDNNNGHGLGAGYLGFAAGLEIEALSADPSNLNGALLGFRSPLLDGKALAVPVTNFQTIVSANPVNGSATFGAPILMDLGGRSLRSMDCNQNGCLMIGGPVGNVTDFRLYTWTGNPADLPELRAADLTAQTNNSSFEGIADLPAAPFTGSAGDTMTVQFIVDTGTFDYYGDGTEAKDLPNNTWKKFRSERVTLGATAVPPVANPGDIVISEIMQNPNTVTDINGEWFELYNNTTGSIDLDGWILQDNGGQSIVINNGGPLTIASGGFLVLGVNADMATNGGVAIDYAYNGNLFSLGNADDEIILITPDNIEIDRVEWDGGPLWPDPNGASMSLQSVNIDNNNGANWCTATTAYGNGDFGTPGAANDCPPPAAADLQITEIWMGQDGDDLTADWFEITNFGPIAWTATKDGDLYYDDDSQDPAAAKLINGITEIQPGESVIVLVDQATAIPTFQNVWSPDYNLTGVQIGWTAGSGLGQGGDAVTLFVGIPAVNSIADYEAYPAAPSGLSWDVVKNDFSVAGAGLVQLGTNIAVATTATAGVDGLEPAVGSPGNKGPIMVAHQYDLKITEIFAGQVGADLTPDWFEIKNVGTEAWVSGVDPELFYDDDSMDPLQADLINGIASIPPGGTAIVLVTAAPADTSIFTSVWSPVVDLTGVEIGWTNGAGLGQTGDLVTLWLGDPAASMPADTASYPDTAPFDGQTWDVELLAFSTVGNASGAVATLALGGTNMDVPNIGSPGKAIIVQPVSGLRISEIFSGQAGADLTADWFEIKNTGTNAWVSGTDPDLFYDDDSMSPSEAKLIEGIPSIQPGATAIVLISANAAADIATFRSVWEPVIDLTGVEIGSVSGAGLGGGGDAVTLWLGDPNLFNPIDTASYPDTAPFDGQSWDVELQAFSVVANANNAVKTIALGGDMMEVPNIGSPGNGLAFPPATGLIISEIFSGQAGADLTADWFEIKNTGTNAWVSGTDPDLFYDDDSMSPSEAKLIEGISAIQPGATAIVLISANAAADITIFRSVWEPVTNLNGVEIGSVSGAGLGGGGDAVTLWLGDPNLFSPIDTASYPDTAPFDGQSWDVELQAFSVVANANHAVKTIALGGDMTDVPNIGSPGNLGPFIGTFDLSDLSGLKVYPNPTSGQITLTAEPGAQLQTVRVIDLSGRVLLSQFLFSDTVSYQLDLSPFAAGIYMLQAQRENGMVVMQIIKE